MSKKKSDHKSNSEYRDDDLIRGAGFKIYARPKDGSPIWERAGIYYPQYRALEIAIRKSQMTDSENE